MSSYSSRACLVLIPFTLYVFTYRFARIPDNRKAFISGIHEQTNTDNIFVTNQVHQNIIKWKGGFRGKYVYKVLYNSFVHDEYANNYMLLYVFTSCYISLNIK